LKPFCEQIEPFTVTSAYNSHRPLLKAALLNTYTGTIIEFGMGEGSTELLSMAAKDQERRFISYENNPEWFAKMVHLHTPYNNLKFVTDWDKAKVVNCSILFIDHAPAERRKVEIERFRGHAEVIIVHDTEPSAEYVYGMSEVLSSFKYRMDYIREGMPMTTVVSDTVNVYDWVIESK
jgi:hypothetical protein